VQVHVSTVQGARGAPAGKSPPQAGRPEESHWRRVEQRGQGQGSDSWGTTAPGKQTSTAAPASPVRQEELMIGLTLASESERGSVKSQNDTDSEISGAHLHHHPHLRVVGSTSPRGSAGAGHGLDPARDRTGATSPLMPTNAATTKAVAAAVASWPPPSPTLSPTHPKPAHGHFGSREDSYYLPSSGVSETESVTSEGEGPPPLPSSAPPGVPATSPPVSPRRQPVAANSAGRTFVSSVSVASVQGQSAAHKGQAKSGSVVGLTIRQRIAQIERQLTVSVLF
jgi:hypothetical protein